jgi:hypothetical protein
VEDCRRGRTFEDCNHEIYRAMVLLGFGSSGTNRRGVEVETTQVIVGHPMFEVRD